jgi:hypothetical protein
MKVVSGAAPIGDRLGARISMQLLGVIAHRCGGGGCGAATTAVLEALASVDRPHMKGTE